MVLESALLNLSRKLDIILQKDDQSISSHSQLKEQALSCLIELVDKAPNLEYERLFASKDYEILLGYLIHILCQISKGDKSKLIRSRSLNIILKLVEKLEKFHNSDAKDGKCSIHLIVTALPGVSSALFKIIMSDTKLPKSILIDAIKTLTKVITVAFLPCKHEPEDPTSRLTGNNLLDTSDNLAVRFNLLVDYITFHSTELSEEVKFEMLIFCEELVCKTNFELISRILKPIVRYTAIFSSTSGPNQSLTAETQLRIMIIIDNIKYRIDSCNDDSNCDRLDSTVISYLIGLLDNLENHCMAMLPGEREAALSMLCGFLKLLPQESLTTLLEITEKRNLMMKILSLLTEFNTNQPFLFLTDAIVGDKAIETCNDRIYTVEKRFKHLSAREVESVRECCSIIGQNCDWLCLQDLFKTELRQFSSSNNLFITHLILKGCLERSDITSRNSPFYQQMIEFYIDKTHEEYLTFNESLKTGETVDSQDLLKVVIAIETFVTLVELHVKSNESKAKKIVILKALLCPLLNWSSSNSRAISESALNALTQLGYLYELKSIKSLIEANIDYIVNGVAQMIENFACNSEVTNVLSITLKLSSLDSFYYFKDIYERVFKLLGAFYHTEKSKPIALLFYRTLSILGDWKEARDGNHDDPNDVPLNNESTVRSIIYEIDIDRRLKKLQSDIAKIKRIRENYEEKTQVTEDQVLEEIRSGKAKEELLARQEDEQAKENDVEEKKEKSPDIMLTEKILTHCINLTSSNYSETKILSLKAAACGFKVLSDDEDTLLPLVHQLWPSLVCRLTGDYNENLEVNLCAFECLVSMAVHSKDFIKSRTLDSIIPRLCLFLESQANQSRGKKEYGPYCMTLAYKCQLKLLTHLGALAYHIQLAYSSLWRVVKTALLYLDSGQVPSLREAARNSLCFMIALDADCVWFFAKRANQLCNLPFELIYDNANSV